MNRAIMTVPGETEAGSAGRQPGRGIAWWAHRDDDRSAEAALLRSSQNHIGSVDPYALKIPARRAESCSLRRELALHFTLNRDRGEIYVLPLGAIEKPEFCLLNVKRANDSGEVPLVGAY